MQILMKIVKVMKTGKLVCTIVHNESNTVRTLECTIQDWRSHRAPYMSQYILMAEFQYVLNWEHNLENVLGVCYGMQKCPKNAKNIPENI